MDISWLAIIHVALEAMQGFIFLQILEIPKFTGI